MRRGIHRGRWRLSLATAVAAVALGAGAAGAATGDTPTLGCASGAPASCSGAGASVAAHGGDEAPNRLLAAHDSRKHHARGKKRAKGKKGKGGNKRKRIRFKVKVIGAGKVVSGKARRKGRKVARPGKIKCPGRCASRFPKGSTVAMRATPQAGYEFQGFSGHARCAGGGRECIVRMGKAAKAGITARFAPIEQPPGRCQVPDTTDSDGDGIPDCTELAGWKLTVNTPTSLSGAGAQTVDVTSDPDEPDTDGDGVDDGAEFLANSNPSSTDTDSDRLGDGDEINTFRSLPNNADTDDDSVPPGGGSRDPRLFDYAEATGLKTNPRIPDTDGDSLSDFVEVVREGTNPRIADLPQVDLVAVPGLSNPQLDFSYTVDETTGTETQQSRTVGQSSSQTTSTTRSEQTTNSHTFTSQTGGKCQTSSLSVGCSVSQQFTDSTTDSVTRGTTSGFSNTQQTSQQYGQIAAQSAQRRVELGPDGCLQVILRLRNSGPVSVSVGDLQVLTTTQDPDDPSETKLLAALQPIQGQEIQNGCPATAPGFGPIELAPGSSTDVAFSQQVGTPILLEYIADPVPISYRLGPISMKGTNLVSEQVDFLGSVATKVDDRTSSLEVDFGNGSIADYEVASQSEYAANGRYAGVTLGEVLGPRLADLDAAWTDTTPSGIEALRDPESGELVSNAPDQRDGVWVIFGNAEGIGDDTVDWQDVVLRPKDKVSIAYVRDTDSDKLPDGYETQIGTDPTKQDTDGDALDDNSEALDGWTVPFPRGQQSSYKVLPSPLSCDADADGSPDGSGPGNDLYGQCPSGQGPESTRLTDPNLADTNGDGQPDGTQPLPDALDPVAPGGRMPELVETWGGTGVFGGDLPTQIAVDPNQPIFDSKGKAAPIDSYVVAHDPHSLNTDEDEVFRFTGNPRAGPPDRYVGSLQYLDGDFFGSPGPITASAVGLDVFEGSVGTGDDAGSPVVVNYYPKEEAGLDPAQGTNAFTTFNGTTGDDLFLNTSAAQPGTVGAYGGLCCFESPIYKTGRIGNGAIDMVGRNAIAIAHGNGSTTDMTGASVGIYRNFGDPTALRFATIGKQADSIPQDPGELVDPSGIAVDRQHGRVYVADQVADGNTPFASLSRFDLNTGNLEAFSGGQDDPDLLGGVRGVAVDPSGDYVYALAQGEGCHGDLLKFSASLQLLGRLEIPTPISAGNCFTTASDFEDIDIDSEGGIWITQPQSKLVRFYFYPFGP